MFVELILVFALTEPLIVKAKFPVSPVKLDLDTGKYESYKIVPMSKCYPPYGCFTNVGQFDPQDRPFNILPDPPEKVNLTLYFFSPKNRKQPQIIRVHQDLKDGKNIDYEPSSSNNYFIIHGWLQTYLAFNSVEADMYEFLAQKDPTCNVFGVDWSGSAINESYVFPMVNTELVGRMIAHFIRRVKMPPNRVHLIGHSLGAQIAGVVGNQFVETKIARIIALDAARPYFEHDFNALKIDSSDAEYVEALHTNIVMLGQENEIGHVDIYPNGGDNHPGCSAQDLKVPPGRLAARLGSRCNHMRSVEIEFTDFGKNQSHCHPIAYACDDYSSFMAGLCSDCGEENENCVLMGFKKDPVLIDKASKSYFIKTGDSENLCLYHYLVEVVVEPISAKFRTYLKIAFPKVKESVSIFISDTKTKESNTVAKVHVSADMIEEFEDSSISLKPQLASSSNYSLTVREVRIKPMSLVDKEMRRKSTVKLRPVVQEIKSDGEETKMKLI